MPSADSVADFLRSAALKRSTVELFLQPRAAAWSRHDPVLGYTNRSAIIRDGIDGCRTIVQYAETGERRMVNHADRPCRINTYGNSFTQGVQVSDGETWQEALAAHFGEPVRNFGIGGYGVYQACRRLMQIEEGPMGAPYVILNLWGDDHHRSLMAWRWLACFEHWSGAEADETFHFAPWAHVRIDPATGETVERPNPFPAPGSLFELCDPDRVVDAFRDDVIVRMQVARRPGAVIDPTPLEALADAVGLPCDGFRDPARLPVAAEALYHACAFRATAGILALTARFCANRSKQLLIVLTYPEGAVAAACRPGGREAPGYFDWHPASVRQAVARLNLPMVDALPCHQADYQAFNITPDEYVRRLYNSHYSPHGNRFLAFAMKDTLVRWLSPPPITYSGSGDIVNFTGYLPT